MCGIYWPDGCIVWPAYFDAVYYYLSIIYLICSNYDMDHQFGQHSVCC